METPHRVELTNLAVELVKRQFAIPDGVLEFDAKIVGGPEDIGGEDFEHDEEGEENPEEPDIDTEDEFEPDDDELTKLEKSKRRLVNATLQGASRVGQYMFHMAEDQLDEILGRGDASNLYGKMMSLNDLSYWLFPDELVKQSSKSGGKAGDEKVDRNTEPPTIYARGINFPTLLHELIKGLMEFFALQPQGEEGDNYYDRVRSEDTITKEDWDLRLGVAIWARLRSLIPTELHMEEKVELQNYILNHIFNLPAKQYLLLMRDVMGKTQNGKRIIEKIAKDMQRLYDEVHNPKYQDDPDYENYDEDGFHYEDEGGNDEPNPTPTKPIVPQKQTQNPNTKVGFDIDNEKWRLNESYTDRYKENPWTSQENLIAFYCEKYGAKNLLPNRGIMNDLAIQIIANHYIGTTEDSLILQMNNFKYLLSNGNSGMSDSSELQRKIYDRFKDYDEQKLRDICVNEMEKIDTREVYNKLKRILDPKLEKNAEIRRMKIIEKNRIEDNEKRFKDEFDRVVYNKNLNPKKLKHIGTKPKEPQPETPSNDDDFFDDHDNEYFNKLQSLSKQLDNPITIDLSKFKEKKRPWNS